MENNANTPDPAEAQAALADIENAERAVRDVPWPIWLYLANAVLLGAIAASFLVDTAAPGALLAVAVATITVNVLAARQLNIPWAVPTNRVFQASCVSAAVFLVAAAVISALADSRWPIVACSIGAAVVYLVGCAFHHRNATR